MKLDHVCFGFSGESLKVEIFFNFFGSFVLRDSILLLPSSLTSHLGNSAKFTKFYRVIPSFNRFNVRLISSGGTDAVRAESVTTRPIF